MKQEQRLLLAFSLTAGVLFLWSVFLPPSPPLPPAQNSSSTQSKLPLLTKETEAPLPEAVDFKVGSGWLSVGAGSGGIHSIAADGVRLLEKSNPGIFQVELLEPDEPIRFETIQAEDQTVWSKAAFDTAELVRTIKPGEGKHKFMSDCRLQLINKAPDKQKFKLRLVAFRPLFAATAQDRQYVGGFVSIEAGTRAIPLKPGQKWSVAGAPDWISAQGKSHAVVIKPIQPAGMFHVEHSGSGAIGWLELPQVELSSGEPAQWDFQLYVGPLDLAMLRESGIGQIVSLGAFPGISKLLIEFMDWSQRWLGNYGLSICLLSFVVWLPFSPLTWYGTRVNKEMMEKMAKIKPLEARIRKENAKNPRRMQQELMELYKKSGINPASGCIGCLPLLLSMPIYIALFQVLNRAPQLRGARFLWMDDLSAPDALIRFPQPLPLIGESLNLLPIVAVACMFVQQQMMKPPQSSLTDEQKIQQQIFMFMPLMLLFFFYNLPSGFVLYWVVNSGLMTGQQLLVKSVRRP